ncbi:MAG: leucine-rich repeat domain-containing protein [Paludibacteraceae bacterium]|nr:leucine-rich repeat domain-containing protein [Paludibacteraceae bacterium]
MTMKHMFTFLVVAFLATGILKAAVGDKFTVDGIEYVILSEDPNEVAVGESVSFVGTTANIPATVMNGATTYTVTELANYGLKNKPSLTSVTLPETVKKIGSHALRDTGITSMLIPNSVDTIEAFAFYGCTALTSVELGNGVKFIGLYTFNDCSNLQTVKIGTGMIKMNYVFVDCPLLIDVTCLAVTPPEVNGTFGGTTSTSIATATLSVPSGSVSAYQGASTWKNFGTIQAVTPTAVHAVLEPSVALYSGKGSVLLTSDASTPVAVYTLTGGKVYENMHTAGTSHIALPQGVYLVKVGAAQEKVVVW